MTDDSSLLNWGAAMTDNGALALASILHDTYGCRITCRGGRLADDRHPSHAEAYLDTAAAVLASLDGVGWRLTARDKASPNERTIVTLRAAIRDANALYEEMAAERAALRAALDVAKRWHDTIAKRDGCDGCELSVALAAAKETDPMVSHTPKEVAGRCKREGSHPRSECAMFAAAKETP